MSFNSDKNDRWIPLNTNRVGDHQFSSPNRATGRLPDGQHANPNWVQRSTNKFAGGCR